MKKIVFILFCNFYLFSIEISPPVRINPDSIEGSCLSITVDLTGKVWVFWVSGEIYAKYFENENWSEIVTFPNSLDWETSAGPVVDRSNRLWFFLGNDFYIWGRYYDGGQWNDLIYVPVFPCANFSHKLTVDSSNNLWVAWTTDWWAPYPIYTRYYDGANWSDTMCVVKDTMGDHITFSFFPDKYGRIWILYQTVGTVSQLSAKKYENGRWSEPFIFSGLGEDGSMINSYNGEFFVLTGKGIKIATGAIFQVYAIRFFTLPDTHIRKIEEDTLSWFYYPYFSLNADKENKIWAFWSLDCEINFSIDKVYFSLYNGSEWLTPELIMDTSDDIWSPVKTCYDPLRDRIWLTWTSRKDGIWGVYVSYIDVNQTSVAENVQFYARPTIFKDWVNIMCKMKEKDILSIYVFNTIGQKVKTLIKKRSLEPGFYNFYFDRKNLQSGPYFIYIKTKKIKKTFKTILIR